MRRDKYMERISNYGEINTDVVYIDYFWKRKDWIEKDSGEKSKKYS